MLTIGEVAVRAGLRPSAIRYYEEKGLVPAPCRRGGKRIYDASVLDRLALVELAKSAGFSLRETRDLLAGVASQQPAAMSWKRVAAAKLQDLDNEMRRVRRMKRLLSSLARCDCPTLGACGRAFRSHRARHQPRSRFQRARHHLREGAQGTLRG